MVARAQILTRLVHPPTYPPPRCCVSHVCFLKRLAQMAKRGAEEAKEGGSSSVSRAEGPQRNPAEVRKYACLATLDSTPFLEVDARVWERFFVWET